MSFSVDRLDADEDGSGSGGDAAAMEVEGARVKTVGAHGQTISRDQS